jgi:hypothetical protein
VAKSGKKLASDERTSLLAILKSRFEKYPERHQGIDWKMVESKLVKNESALWSLNEMEKTGGEPDVTGYVKKSDEFIFCDCSAESPSGRRSLCYDKEGLDSRKEHKPENSAVEVANQIGIEILTEQEYRELQQLGTFDNKTSSWLKTPAEIRRHGGAIFADFRYGHLFVYHNGAGSYYAARGFRGILKA